jgi:hypothetical protein
LLVKADCGIHVRHGQHQVIEMRDYHPLTILP